MTVHKEKAGGGKAELGRGGKEGDDKGTKGSGYEKATWKPTENIEKVWTYFC